MRTDLYSTQSDVVRTFKAEPTKLRRFARKLDGSIVHIDHFSFVILKRKWVQQSGTKWFCRNAKDILKDHYASGTENIGVAFPPSHKRSSTTSFLGMKLYRMFSAKIPFYEFHRIDMYLIKACRIPRWFPNKPSAIVSMTFRPDAVLDGS